MLSDAGIPRRLYFRDIKCFRSLSFWRLYFLSFFPDLLYPDFEIPKFLFLESVFPKFVLLDFVFPKLVFPGIIFSDHISGVCISGICISGVCISRVCFSAVYFFHENVTESHNKIEIFFLIVELNDICKMKRFHVKLFFIWIN